MQGTALSLPELPSDKETWFSVDNARGNAASVQLEMGFLPQEEHSE